MPTISNGSRVRRCYRFWHQAIDKIIENIGNGIIPHGLSNWLPIAATCIYLLSIPRNFALLYELAAT